MTQEPVLGRFPSTVSISNSELSTFKECRRKWYLSYYRGLTPKAQKLDGPLALGTRIHYALELYYIQGVHPLDTYRSTVNEDRIWLMAANEDTAKFDKEAELGNVMLEGYLEWLEETGADSEFEIVSAEEKLSIPILDGKVQLIGKLDMRVRRKVDGVRLFFDHKTAASINGITDTAHMNWQPKMYMLLEALKEDEDQRCDGMVYNILKKVKRAATAKPPFYLRHEVRHNKHTMNSFWLEVHGVIKQIMDLREALDSGQDHRYVAYPTPTNDCTWKCPFFAVCGIMDDGSAAEAMIEDYYKQADPYARYEEETK